MISVGILLGCQWQDGNKSGGTIVVRLKKHLTSINPLSGDPEVRKVTSVLFRGLTRFDKELRIRPALAESWTISENGQVILFTLRDNLRWHDGRKVTADDVVYTYRSMMRGESTTIAQTNIQQFVEDVVAYDERTVRFALRRPFSPFLADTTTPILPKHLFQGEPDLLGIPITLGNGLFSLKEINDDGSIDLVRFENGGEKPLLDGVRFKVITDVADVPVLLQRGELDIADVDFDTFSQISGDTTKQLFSELGFNYVAFNLRDGRLFSDRNLRQAWQLGVDREGLVRESTDGKGLAVVSHIPVHSWAYDKEVTRTGRDIEKAKDLLKSSGWMDSNGDGIAEKGGKSLSFDLLVRKDDPNRVKAAYLLRAQLKDIGMDVKVKPADFDTEMTAKRRPPFDFDAMIMGWDIGADPDDYYLFASGQIATEERPFLHNYVGFSSSTFDEASRKGRTIYDYPERKKPYSDSQRILNEELPYYFLWAEQTGVVASPRVKGPIYLSDPWYLSEIDKVWLDRSR